jgi:alkylhydroperoxidase family enzyme
VTSQRIDPGNLRQLGLFNWVFSKVAARTLGLSDMHLFSTLGRGKGLFRGWLHYSAGMMPFGSLARHDTELVIIRTAHLRNSEYELDHHKRLGKRAGIDEAEFARIRQGPDAGWSGKELALLRAVDELVGTKDLSDLTWKELSAHLDDRRLIEFVMLVGQYDSLATTIGTLRIERDH